MKKNIIIKCPHCEYVEDLSHGKKQSFRIIDINTLIQTTPSLKQAQDLQVLKDKYAAHIVGIPELKLFECPECHTLHCDIHYELALNDGRTISNKHLCPKCNATLVRVNKFSKLDLSKYRCNRCGKKLSE